MPTAPPQEGDTYTFLGAVTGQDEEGNPVRGPIGNPPGHIAPGTVMKVREVVDAGEIGAFDDSEDAVVFEFEEPTLVFNEESGDPEIGYANRAWSVGVSELQSLFKKGS